MNQSERNHSVYPVYHIKNQVCGNNREYSCTYSVSDVTMFTLNNFHLSHSAASNHDLVSVRFTVTIKQFVASTDELQWHNNRYYKILWKYCKILGDTVN